MSAAEAFGRALRQRRLDAELTQEQLALEADLGRVFVSLLETGKRQPTFQTMLKLAAALGCKAADIVAEAEALVDGEP